MKAADFWREIKTIANETATRYTPFRAKATKVNNNGIQIQTYDSESPLGERYSQLRGPSVNPGDEVAVIPYGGSNLILGAIDSNPPHIALTDRAEVSTTASTTSIGIWHPCLSKTFLEPTRPSGSWKIWGSFGVALRPNSGGYVGMRLLINGAERAIAYSQGHGNNVWVYNIATLDSVTVSATSPITVELQIRTNHGTELAAKTPWFSLIGWRS